MRDLMARARATHTMRAGLVDRGGRQRTGAQRSGPQGQMGRYRDRADCGRPSLGGRPPSLPAVLAAEAGARRGSEGRSLEGGGCGRREGGRGGARCGGAACAALVCIALYEPKAAPHAFETAVCPCRSSAPTRPSASMPTCRSSNTGSRRRRRVAPSACRAVSARQAAGDGAAGQRAAGGGRLLEEGGEACGSLARWAGRTCGAKRMSSLPESGT